jgi:hypothetical protein
VDAALCAVGEKLKVTVALAPAASVELMAGTPVALNGAPRVDLVENESDCPPSLVRVRVAVPFDPVATFPKLMLLAEADRCAPATPVPLSAAVTDPPDVTNCTEPLAGPAAVGINRIVATTDPPGASVSPAVGTLIGANGPTRPGSEANVIVPVPEFVSVTDACD